MASILEKISERATPETLTGQSSLSLKAPTGETQPAQNFLAHLKESFHDVNKAQQHADELAATTAMGKKQDIHETMLALSQAELSFNLMVQVRNKALEAYQEIMRMPV